MDPVDDLEKVDLDLEAYYEKWSGVEKTNAAVLIQIDTVLMGKAKEQTGTPRTPDTTATGDFVRFNPASDLKPKYLKRNSNMLEVRIFCDHQQWIQK